MDMISTQEPVHAWDMTDSLHAEQGKGDPFAAAIRATRMAMIITDPRQRDNPVVFANDAFLKLTGYAREDVLGRNCRFLQGPDTDPGAIARIQDAIEQRTDIAIDLLNYTSDGRPFWNALYMSPVSNEQGELQFYFASLVDVSERKRSEHHLAAEKERFEQAVRDRTAQLKAALDAQTMLIHEVDHRVKNNLQMISSLIVMQSRSIADENIKRSLRAMLERIEAVSTVHRRLYQSDDVTQFNVSDFIRDLVTDLLAASGREEIKAEFDLVNVVIAADKATPVALMVNELVTNALKHAFGPDTNGNGPKISVRLRGATDSFAIEVADNGKGLPAEHESSEAKSFGTRLIKSLVRQLHADIQWRDEMPGTRAIITIPASKE